MKNAIIFPSSPFNSKKVDEEFIYEENLVRSLGGKVVLIDHNEITQGKFVSHNLLPLKKARDYDNFIGTREESEDLMASTEDIPYDATAFYRGWMMTPDEYQFMRWQLGLRLVEMRSDTSDYMSGYYLGHWYSHFQDVTPLSTYFPSDYPQGEYLPMVKSFLGDGPYIVKDHVKSRKYEWDTACYSPTLETLPSIINEFIRLQGDSLNVGIAVRKFEEFDKSFGEMRIWWINGELAMISPHPDTPHLYQKIDTSFLEPYVKSFRRPFVTTDVALRVDGTYRVVEVSDGQVSGVPRGFDMTPLFKALVGE